MSDKPSVEAQERFFWFIEERHKIYLRRAFGKPWPWTKDKILQDYRFCNVFRENDKVTIWIRENWRTPYASHRNLWLAMAIARQINWPPTLKEIGFPAPWDPDHVVRVLNRRKEAGLKRYTGAYMLTGSLGDCRDKAELTAYLILDPLYRDPPPIWKTNTLEDAFKLFQGRPGFGPFLSYEVVTDLRHTRYLQNAPDILTWANAGPGALRGLSRIFGREFKRRERSRNLPAALVGRALNEMRYLLSLAPQYLGKRIPPLEMRDIEHCLCEFDKYERMRLGQGVLERYRPTEQELV